MVDQPTPNPDADAAREAYELRCHAHTFGLLARLWIDALDAPMLLELQDEPTCEAYRDVGGFVPDTPAPPATLTQQLAKLAEEYRACLQTPKDYATPLQSNFSQDDLMTSLQAYVDLLGAPEVNREAPPPLDHAGVQLQLMQRILNEMAEVFQQRRSEPSPATESNWESLIQLRDTFYQTHLEWLVSYCKTAKQNSNSPFYHGLFDVTSLLLGGD